MVFASASNYMRSFPFHICSTHTITHHRHIHRIHIFNRPAILCHQDSTEREEQAIDGEREPREVHTRQKDGAATMASKLFGANIIIRLQLLGYVYFSNYQVFVVECLVHGSDRQIHDILTHTHTFINKSSKLLGLIKM